MITTVNTAAGLTTALKTAQAGDVIQLSAGNYGLVALGNLRLTDVTITSADPGARAVMTGLNITSSTGITVRNIDFALGGDAVNITSSQNIVLDGDSFHGTADKNLLNDPYAGVNLRNASNVTIQNSEFHDLVAGVQHQNSDHILIEDNRLHDIRMDGIRGGGSNWVTIRDNFFTDFYRNGSEHPDMIQFWTTGTTTATHDITIADNVFLRGKGTYVQGIFVGNEALIPYENLTITGNLVAGAQYHGLAVMLAKDAVVTDNTVVGFPDMASWIYLKDTTGTRLDGNVTSSWNLTNNTYVFKQATPAVAAVSDGGAALYADWQADHAVPATPTTPPTTPTTPPAAPVIPVLAESAPFTKFFWGGSFNNVLTGTSGADKIDGLQGSDTMTGGAGDDLYLVDNAGDKVVELAGGGVDTVQLSGASYTLADNVENLALKGTGQSAVGNAQGNLIFSGASGTVNGAAGDDILVAAGLRDVLTGGAGHDLFRFDKLPAAGAETHVTDFTQGQDLVDLRKLLTAYAGSDPVADGWVKVQDTPAGLNVLVDLDGKGAAKAPVVVAVLDGYHGPFAAGADWLFH